MRYLAKLALSATIPLVALFAYPSSATDESAPMVAVGVGDIMIEGALARATSPDQTTARAFAIVKNRGGVDDVLLSASADFASRVAFGEPKLVGDTKNMVLLPAGVVIPAGGAVELRPDETQILLIDLKQKLTKGDTITVTLNFGLNGSVEVPFTVGGHDAKAPSQ
ncbi:MAG: copper chaperone PCu(A)C [Boseongicola sp.]|nr:copper chaperone PCu(A)C [Boseongicola sp.]